MNTDTLERMLDKIKAYDKIMIFRHRRPDGDCVGASKGLKQMLRLSFPEKLVRLIDDARSEYLSFLGEDDAPVADEAYQGALGIVLDTASTERISNPKYALCRELVKIDHHINVEPFGDLQWVEDGRSSTCEMIAAFYAAFPHALRLDRLAATCLYAGMVTDSGRFRYEGVTGDTLRLAAVLLDQGVDTERLYAHLYLKDFDLLRFQAYVYEHAVRTENGVAYIVLPLDTQRAFNLSFEDASAAISYLDAIKSCLCWINFIEDPGDHAIRVRLRSRFVTVNALASRYRGGGHARASGATVYSREEIDALVREADAMVKQYKDTHDDWL